MEIIVRYTDGCPHREEAVLRIQSALATAGFDAVVRVELVASAADAERLGFAGSPAIIIDGVDPFRDATQPAAFACRLYHTEIGMEGTPSVGQIARALTDRLIEP